MMFRRNRRKWGLKLRRVETHDSFFSFVRANVFALGVSSLTTFGLIGVPLSHAQSSGDAMSSGFSVQSHTHSQLGAAPEMGVVVRVRAIHASGDGGASEGATPQVEPAIGDISSQLSKLPFARYTFVGAASESVPMLRKETIILRGGNNLTVRPLYVAEGKVGVWLRWVDDAGMRVLDTRLRLTPGESMIAGSDIGSGEATVLAIDVTPQDLGSE